MHNFSIHEDLEKTLSKLAKRDPVAYSAVINKIQEIVANPNVDRYKNLRKPLQHLKRVHIMGSFVLTFHYNLKDDSVVFYHFDHHDYVYK